MLRPFFIGSLIIFFSNISLADICSRSLPIRREIEKTLAKSCDQISVADLNKILKLEVPYNKTDLFVLKNGDLEGLTSMSYLFLNSTLTQIENQAFKGLPSLQSLIICSSQLTSLPEDVFKDLSQLQNLSLRYTGLTEIPAGLFTGLYNLKSLMLSENPELTTLPENVFSHLKLVENMYLADLPLHNFSAETFRGLSHLKYLSFNSKNITNIPADLFKDLGELELLNFWAKNLKTVPEVLFRDLKSLKVLSFLADDLGELSTKLFMSTSKLKTLHLYGLGAVRTGLFDGLSALEKLVVWVDHSDTIDEDVFRNLPLLVDLGVVGHSLTNLPLGLFNGLKKLTSLNLNNWKLTSLPSGVFSDLTSLQYLELDVTPLAHLPADIFWGLASLEQITMENTRLTFLPEDLFRDLANLKTFNFFSDRMVHLPSLLFRGTPKLEEAIIDSPLVNLPVGLFDGLTDLKGVGFNNIVLTEVSPEMFSPQNFNSQAKVFFPVKNFLTQETISLLNSQLGDRLAFYDFDGRPQGISYEFHTSTLMLRANRGSADSVYWYPPKPWHLN